MSQGEKSHYYQILKDADYPFEKHYREYTVAELKDAATPIILAAQAADPEPQPQHPELAGFFGLDPKVPVAAKDPNEMAGARLNTQGDEPIRTDPETGRVWYQEEVLKPAFPKSRGRRVLKYQEPGVKEVQVTNGQYTETFEIAGEGPTREAEVKITLPSYQVGIYKHPSFPFRVVCYNGNEGFDLFEVQEYYGGAELVPQEVTRKYVENVLCYDIRTVVRAIETEYRAGVLAGKIR